MTFTIPNVGAAAYPAQAGPDAVDFAVLAASVALTGVVTGCAVTAQATPDATAAVGAGVARVAGRRAVVAGGNVTFTAADATNPRHDLVTVDASGTLAVVAGSPAAITTAAEPVFPTVPADRAVLAAVYRPPGTTVINTNQLTDKRVTVLDPGVENVTWYGATGDGVTDDTAAIQAAVTASRPGSTVVFPGSTPGGTVAVYLVSAQVRYLGGRAYEGTGYGFGGVGAVIRQKAGSNITEAGGISGILVPDGWYANATVCDNPVLIRNLYVDGNKGSNTGNACGIVLMNYWSTVERCQVVATPLHGIHLTDVGRNGTTVISNSASENRVRYCRIDSPSGHGISQVSQNGNSNQDGYCEGNIIVSPTINGINFARAAGWVFRRNHFYGVQYSAIDMANGYATIIDSNYIEGFGAGAIAGATYVGISLTQLAGRGSHITNNLIANDDTLAGVTAFRYIVASAANAQAADMVVAGNICTGNNGANGTGLYVQTTGGTGAAFHLRASNNIIRYIANPSTLSGNVSTFDDDSWGREHAIYNGTTTAAGGAARGTSPPVITFAGNDQAGKFTFGTGTATTTGALGTVTFAAPYQAAPVVLLTAATSPTAGLGLYATATTTGFTINAATAPAVSQGGTVYAVNYNVRG